MSTHPHHAIRLAGPWTLSLAVLGSDAISVHRTDELRINLTKPDVEAWHGWFRQQLLELKPFLQPNQQIQILCQRKFNQPTGLTAAQRLSVEIEYADPSFCDCAVEVNGKLLSGNVGGDLRFAAELERLESFNSLTIGLLVSEVDFDLNDVAVPPFRSARLVIHE